MLGQCTCGSTANSAAVPATTQSAQTALRAHPPPYASHLHLQAACALRLPTCQAQLDCGRHRQREGRKGVDQRWEVFPANPTMFGQAPGLPTTSCLPGGGSQIRPISCSCPHLAE